MRSAWWKRAGIADYHPWQPRVDTCTRVPGGWVEQGGLRRLRNQPAPAGLVESATGFNPWLMSAVFGFLLLLLPCRITPAQTIQPIPGSIHYRYTRAIGGWLPNWQDVNGTGPGWQTVQANADNLDEVSFFSFDADPTTGNLTPPVKDMDPATIVQQVGWLHTREVAAFVTITQFDHVHEILSDPARLNQLIAQIVQVSNLYSFDGVDIDFEDFKKIDPQDSERFTNFANQLADAMHAQTDWFGYPKMAVITVLPQTQRGRFAYIDYNALANSRVDRIRVMAYDEYYPGSHSAGACAPLPWYGQVASFIHALGPGNQWKFEMGIPGYSYKWPVNGDSDRSTIGHGSSVTYPEAVALIAQHNAARMWDKTSGAPYLTYRAWYAPPAPPTPPSTPAAATQTSTAQASAAALATPKTTAGVTATVSPAAATLPTPSAPASPSSTPTPPAQASPQPGVHTWIAYYEDAQSWKVKVQSVLLNSGMNGIADWALGYEDPGAWPMLDKTLAPLYPIYGAIGFCYWRYGGGARFGDVLGPEHSAGVSQAGSLDGYAGREQDFEWARFYYKWGAPRAYVLYGDILNQYLTAGGPSGSLGFPISDPVTGPDGKITVQFEHGLLTTSPALRASQGAA